MKKKDDKKANIPTVKRKLVSEQAADTLRDFIRGKGKTLFQLPPISELSKQLGVSIVNVHKAVTMLQAEGMVEVIQGKGVFTKPAVQQLTDAGTGPAIGLISYSDKAALDVLAGAEGFYARVIRGIVQEAGAQNHRVIMHWMSKDVADNPGTWSDIEVFAIDNKIQGALLLRLLQNDLTAWIAERIKPSLLIDHWAEGVAIDTVNPDNHGAAKMGAKHLIDQGHKDILYIFHRKKEMNPPRLDGYYAALEEAGIEAREDLVVYCDLGEIAAKAKVKELVEKGLEFTALMTFDGGQATGAADALRELGKQVPILTFGADRVPDDELVSAVDFQPEDVGRLSLRRLIDRIKKPDLAVEDLVVSTKVLKRGAGA